MRTHLCLLGFDSALNKVKQSIEKFSSNATAINILRRRPLVRASPNNCPLVCLENSRWRRQPYDRSRPEHLGVWDSSLLPPPRPNASLRWSHLRWRETKACGHAWQLNKRARCTKSSQPAGRTGRALRVRRTQLAVAKRRRCRDTRCATAEMRSNFCFTDSTHLSSRWRSLEWRAVLPPF